MTRPTRALAPLIASSLILLAGCGSSSDSSSSDDPTLTAAVAVLGQTGFTTASANQAGPAAATTVSQPLGGATGVSGGPFYVPDFGNSRILGYNSVPTATNTPANFVLGQADFSSGQASSGAGVFAFPQSAWIGSGKLVVADTSNNRVLIWNTPPTANVPPDVIVGQTDAAGNSAGLSQTQLSTPAAAAIANNRLFVVDQGNNRVLIWNAVPTTNGAPADIVLGQADFVTGTSAVTQSRMSQPNGIWTDGFRLLVSDGGNNRILYWTAIPNSNQANASFVIGQSSFTFSTTVPSAQTMNTPVGIASDGTRLFVADSGNNRVLIFDSFPIANNTAADDVLGQENFTHVTANIDNGDDTFPQDDSPQETAITARTLSRPSGVFYLGGRLYVTDRGNNRIMLFAE